MADKKDVPVLTVEEVAKHNKEGDAWVIVDGLVYNVSTFAGAHPGGEKLLMDLAGKDVTSEFFELHRTEILQKYQKLVIGKLEGAQFPFEVPRAGISSIPFAEGISERNGWTCPYMNEGHSQFRANVRAYLAEWRPYAETQELAGKMPTKPFLKKLGDAGVFRGMLGPGPHLKGHTIFGVKGEDFDNFHEMILAMERARMGYPSFSDGLGTGLVIGLPPVHHFGQPEVKKRVVEECLSGEKQICLAVSEPWAGSDVANIKTTATKSECGKYYIVNGVKKWITNGHFADYFTTAVRTGGPGIAGISLLCVPRGEGVETKILKTSYGSSAGTALVIYENAKVPVEYLLGEENGGFQCIMANFNHERWFVTCLLVGGLRGLLDETFTWVVQRKAFGKPLIKQPSVRQKLADMVAQTETLNGWLESLTYQMQKMDYDQQFMLLGSAMSLMKYQCSRATYQFNDSVVQLFGGRSLSIKGMGENVERFQRQVKYAAILGGSEEVMGDLGIRLAERAIPPDAHL